MKHAKPYHHGNLKAALLERALAVLNESGPESLSLRELATQAGVSANGPYRHFKDKDTLLAAAAETGFVRLTQSLALVATSGPGKRFREIADAYVAFAEANSGLYRLMFDRRSESLMQYPGLKQASESLWQLLTEAVRVLLGEPKIDSDVQRAAMASWAILHGYAHLKIQGAAKFVEPEAFPAGAELARMLAKGIRN
jgi:AcrR family transcriptional regulator